jgi:8-oxo-dGTP diphosphatase
MSSPQTITCVDKDGNLHEVSVSSLRPRLSAYAIIIQDGKILLSPQWDGYDVPGGWVELGETLEQGLIREVKEETGFDVVVDDIVTSQTSFFKMPNREDDFVQSLMNFYTAHIVWGELSTDWFDENEKKYAKVAEWVYLKNLDNLKFYCSVDLLAIIKTVISHSL